MSKRFDVYPSYMGNLLRDWARKVFVDSMYRVTKGYPTKAAFVALKVDGQCREVPLWNTTQEELERLDRYINELETRHIMALNWAFVPHRSRSSIAWLTTTGTVPRTWRRWVHEAVAELDAVWSRVGLDLGQEDSPEPEIAVARVPTRAQDSLVSEPTD